MKYRPFYQVQKMERDWKVFNFTMENRDIGKWTVSESLHKFAAVLIFSCSIIVIVVVVMVESSLVAVLK